MPGGNSLAHLEGSPAPYRKPLSCLSLIESRLHIKEEAIFYCVTSSAQIGALVQKNKDDAMCYVAIHAEPIAYGPVLEASMTEIVAKQYPCGVIDMGSLV